MTRLDAVPCASGCEVSIADELTTVMFQGMWLRTKIRGSHNVGPETEVWCATASALEACVTSRSSYCRFRPSCIETLSDVSARDRCGVQLRLSPAASRGGLHPGHGNTDE